MGNPATIYAHRGEVDAALDYSGKAQQPLHAVYDRLSLAVVRANRGSFLQNMGRLSEALEQDQLALETHRDLGHPMGHGVALGNIGNLHFEAGDFDRAEAALTEAIDHCDEVMPAATAAAFRGTLALLEAQRGALEKARALIAAGEPQLRGKHNYQLAKFLCRKAQVQCVCGAIEIARATLAEVTPIIAEYNAGPDSELAKSLAAAQATLAETA